MKPPEDEVQRRSALLAHGTSAVVRPLEPGDRAAVTALFESCSEANIYLRFFTLGRTTVTRHIDHLFDPTSTATVYVAEVDGRTVGIADVEPCEGSTSEIAFLVADDMHGQGVATILLERAAQDAWANGTKWFVADVLAVNHPMLEVFQDSGYRIEQHAESGEVSLRMSTQSTPRFRTAHSRRRRAADQGRTRLSLA